MGLTNEFAPVYTNDLGQGLGPYGNCTPYNTAQQNNGAPIPPGSLAFIPAPAQGQNILTTTAGYAWGLWVKMVLYKSTGNPAVQTGPAPLYYKDETGYVVSGVFTEGMVTSTGSASSFAGWLLPNSGTVAGIGAGTTAFTNTILNNSGNGSWVYMGIQGFIPSAYLAAGAQTNLVYGAAGNWTVAAIADGSAITHRAAAYVWGAVTSNIADILVSLPLA